MTGWGLSGIALNRAQILQNFGLPQSTRNLFATNSRKTKHGLRAIDKYQLEKTVNSSPVACYHLLLASNSTLMIHSMYSGTIPVITSYKKPLCLDVYFLKCLGAGDYQELLLIELKSCKILVHLSQLGTYLLPTLPKQNMAVGLLGKPVKVKFKV